MMGKDSSVLSVMIFIFLHWSDGSINFKRWQYLSYVSKDWSCIGTYIYKLKCFPIQFYVTIIIISIYHTSE